MVMETKAYYINNIPVHVRTLPSADIAIWHPYNINVYKAIDLICRGKGHWNSQYNNWIIFQAFADDVISSIAEMSNRNG